jgi:hypothetical protein
MDTVLLVSVMIVTPSHAVASRCGCKGIVEGIAGSRMREIANILSTAHASITHAISLMILKCSRLRVQILRAQRKSAAEERPRHAASTATRRLLPL